MRQDQMTVLFEEIGRFTETLVARLMALDEITPAKVTKAVRKATAAKTPVKVTNGTHGRPRAELTKAEAATYLKVSGNTIDAWSKRGVIPPPHTKEGNRAHFYFQSDLANIERPKRGRNAL